MVKSYIKHAKYLFTTDLAQGDEILRVYSEVYSRTLLMNSSLLFCKSQHVLFISKYSSGCTASYELLHMNTSVGQPAKTYIGSVWTQDTIYWTCPKQWFIGTSGERIKGIHAINTPWRKWRKLIIIGLQQRPLTFDLRAFLGTFKKKWFL